MYVYGFGLHEESVRIAIQKCCQNIVCLLHGGTQSFFGTKVIATVVATLAVV